MGKPTNSCMWAFRCDPDLREAVKAKAAKEGRTATSVIRQALRAYIANQETQS